MQRITNNGFIIATLHNDSLNYTCDAIQGLIQLRSGATLIKYTGNCSFSNDHIIMNYRLILPNIMLNDFVAKPDCCAILDYNYTRVNELPPNFNFKELGTMKNSDIEIQAAKHLIENFHLTHYRTIGLALLPLILVFVAISTFVIIQRRRVIEGRIIIDEHMHNTFHLQEIQRTTL